MEWFALLENEELLSTPSLLVNPEFVDNNIKRMIEIAGNSNRLRPHIKTIKSSAIISKLINYGITKIKCATIAEAEVAANTGIEDILIAYPLAGGNLFRYVSLVKNFPHVSFSILTDSLSGANSINSLSKIENKNHKVFIDIDCGMHRTGIEVEEVYELFLFLKDCENIDFSGLHVYDGHVHDHSEKLRFSKSEEIVNSIRRLEKVLLQDQNSFDIIIGGSPTFPMYASLTSYDLSPGTTVLWDFGYGEAYPEMGFDIAAVLAGRVVSKPSKNQVCIDLGYKAMASEMNHPRIKFHGINDYIVKNQSEEHLVIEANECINIEIGHLLYGIPRHICPTVALYDTYSVIENNKVTTTWPIEGRKRKITY